MVSIILPLLLKVRSCMRSACAATAQDRAVTGETSLVWGLFVGVWFFVLCLGFLGVFVLFLFKMAHCRCVQETHMV